MKNLIHMNADQKMGTSPFKCRVVAVLALWGSVLSAFAGGGGENILVVVNPGDEQQVRIANAYQKLHDIPDSNFVFIELRKQDGMYLLGDRKTEGSFNYVDHFLVPIADHIAEEGLSGQIDYITTLGQPYKMSGLSAGVHNISHDHLLCYLDDLVSGVSPEDRMAINSPRYTKYKDNSYENRNEPPYVEGSNNELRYSDDGLYIGTTLGYTGMFGNTPDDVIANLQRTAQSAGTKPIGKIYFEENANIRSAVRKPQWPYTQPELDARGIGWEQPVNSPGSSPRNRSAVRGAVIGAATYAVPNGSTYIPGSWADSLTSFGFAFAFSSQTKVSELIKAGVGGTSGTVYEPSAIASRFTKSHIFLYLADGSTLGEAYYKSLQYPFLSAMLGDPLGQPYADIPTVLVVSGPADESMVSGNIQFVVNASLPSPSLATGIDRIDLYVDGKLTDTVSGDNASFSVDTTTLSDGYHRFRLVGVNNAAAKSQGYLLRYVVVNNDNRSVSAGENIDAGTATLVSVPLTSSEGSGTLIRIELHHLGRVIGTLNAAAGNLNLDVSPLAYGENTVEVVGIFSDGSEVFGSPITISRSPAYWPSLPVSPAMSRSPGILGEYFTGQGAFTIAASTFVNPDLTKIHNRLLIGVHDGSDYSKTPLDPRSDIEPHPVGRVDDLTLVHQLSARYSGRFTVPVDGEYNFFGGKMNDSAKLLIDGQEIFAFDNVQYGLYPKYTPAVFLAAGEHELELLVSNVNNGGGADGWANVALYVRKPGGLTQVVDSSFLFQKDASGYGSWGGDWMMNLDLYMGLSINPAVTKKVGFYKMTGGGGVAPSVSLGELAVTLDGATNGQSMVYTGGLDNYVFHDATNYVVTTRLKVTQFPDSIPMVDGGPSNVGLNIFDLRGMDRVYIHLEPDRIWVQNHDGKWRKAADILTEEGVYYTWEFEVFQDPAGTSGIVNIFRRTSDSDAWATIATRVEIGNLNVIDQWRIFPIFHNVDNAQIQGGVVSDYLAVAPLPADPGSLFYREWAAGFGLAAKNGLQLQDSDSDGMNNLVEYALGGDPTTVDALAVLPTSEVRPSSGTNWLEYVYNRRVDYGARGLEYTIETTADLASGVWSNLNYRIEDIGPVAGGFESVTNRLIINTIRNNFIRLRIKEN